MKIKHAINEIFDTEPLVAGRTKQ